MTKNVRYICLHCNHTFLDTKITYNEICWSCGDLICPLGEDEREILSMVMRKKKAKAPWDPSYILNKRNNHPFPEKIHL